MDTAHVPFRSNRYERHVMVYIFIAVHNLRSLLCLLHINEMSTNSDFTSHENEMAQSYTLLWIRFECIKMLSQTKLSPKPKANDIEICYCSLTRNRTDDCIFSTSSSSVSSGSSPPVTSSSSWLGDAPISFGVPECTRKNQVLTHKHTDTLQTHTRNFCGWMSMTNVAAKRWASGFARCACWTTGASISCSDGRPTHKHAHGTTTRAHKTRTRFRCVLYIDFRHAVTSCAVAATLCRSTTKHSTFVRLCDCPVLNDGVKFTVFYVPLLRSQSKRVAIKQVE